MKQSLIQYNKIYDNKTQIILQTLLIYPYLQFRYSYKLGKIKNFLGWKATK
mgnify:CR=1 FL=1